LLIIGEYFDKVSNIELINFYNEKLTIFEEIDEIDFIAYETIPTKIDIINIVSLMKNSKKKAWITFCCKNYEELSSGEKIIDCVKIINECDNIIAIGVNFL
jgi:homocysteine S-methyltransferase